MECIETNIGNTDHVYQDWCKLVECNMLNSVLHKVIPLSCIELAENVSLKTLVEWDPY